MCSSCGYLRPSFLREGSGGGVRPPVSPSRRKPACGCCRWKDTPANPLTCYGGLAGGVSGSLTAMRARFRAFQHGQQSQDMTGSACRFWRGLCVRAGSMLARRVSQVLWSTPPPGSQARVKPKARAGEAGLDLSKEHLRTQELESCAPVADTFGLSFLRGGVRGRSTPPVSPSRRKPGLRCR